MLGNRMVQQVFAILLRRLAGETRRDPEHITVEEEQLGGVRAAQTRQQHFADPGVQDTSPGVGGERAGRAPRDPRGRPRTGGARLADSWCCRNEALVVRDMPDGCSLGSAIVTPVRNVDMNNLCLFYDSSAPGEQQNVVESRSYPGPRANRVCFLHQRDSLPHVGCFAGQVAVGTFRPGPGPVRRSRAEQNV